MPADSPENKCPDECPECGSEKRWPPPVWTDGESGVTEECWHPWHEKPRCPDCGGSGANEFGDAFNNPCQTCGGSGRINTSGPDDSKIESKYQGASPSVPPAVTTDGVPVVREGRGECWKCAGDGTPGRCCRFCCAPSVVSGDGQNEARIEAATKAAAAVYPEDHDPIFVNGLARKMVEAAAPFLVSASDESATRDRVLAAIKETIDLHDAPPLAPTPDLEPSYSTLYRLVVAALDKKGQDDG